MRKRAVPWLITLLFLTAAICQAQGIGVRVRVVIIDRDLNQKPVPRFGILMRALDAQIAPSPAEAKTGLDGIAELQVVAGRYKILSAQPLDFQGKQYQWDLEVNVEAASTEILLSNDNASVTEGSPQQPSRITDELTNLYRKYQASVVTVWSEIGHGTGFIVDPLGLILTNQHVIGPSEYLGKL